MEGKIKDGWDKAEIILKPVGGLLAAIAISLLGFFGSRSLEKIKRIETQNLEKMKQEEMRVLQERQSQEACARLYSELMSKREESESSLRKDMFSRIIDDFLKPGSKTIDSPDKRLLNLELLVYNFHESLNLKPLFIDIKKQLRHNAEYINRLDKVAREVTSKQMLILEGAGKKISRTIDLKSLQFFSNKMNSDNQNLEDFIYVDLTLDGIKRNFIIGVMDADPNTKEVQIYLEIKKYKDSNIDEVYKDSNIDEDEIVTANFWVGSFDFPMIDNTRLSNDQRCAIVLDDWNESTAGISLIYYPGSYASLKEKPYYLEVIQNLLRTNDLLCRDLKKSP